MQNLLEIKNLFATADQKQILNGLCLNIKPGETHVIMGPNGAGKTTLSNVILSNPHFTKTGGTITFLGQDITNLSTTEIARLGVFVSFQNPQEIEGLSVFNFIKTAKSKTTNQKIDVFELQDELSETAKKLSFNESMLGRDLNVNFSGGEKKKNEMLQMLSLNPKLAILDETDSGLDVDATKIVSNAVSMFKTPENAVLVITHSARILQNMKVDKVHVLVKGKIVKSGGMEIVEEIEKNGYKNFL